MLDKNSEVGAKKTGAKPSKSKKSTLASQAVGIESKDERHKIVATAAYFRAEKRGFKGNGADAVQDWLEAELEIDNAKM